MPSRLAINLYRGFKWSHMLRFLWSWGPRWACEPRIGSFCCVPLAFIFPVLCHFKLCQPEGKKVLLNVAVLLLGLALFVYTSLSSLNQMGFLRNERIAEFIWQVSLVSRVSNVWHHLTSLMFGKTLSRKRSQESERVRFTRLGSRSKTLANLRMLFFYIFLEFWTMPIWGHPVLIHPYWQMNTHEIMWHNPVIDYLICWMAGWHPFKLAYWAVVLVSFAIPQASDLVSSE